MSTHHYLRDWRLHMAMALAMVMPVLIALLLSWYGLKPRPEPFQPVVLPPQVFNSTQQLEALFAQHGYEWPPEQAVPAVAIKQLPGDLGQLPVAQKKSLFFRILLPLTLAENQRLAAEREWLLAIQRGESAADAERLTALAMEYRIEPTQPLEALLSDLLLRVDVVPVGLVLAQAANESGWGTSRFSRVANNLFGEWTWNAAQGILPASRPEGATHYVRRFDSLRDSVRSYMHNLNSGSAYSRFRQLRAHMRKSEETLDPHRLAEGLVRYSARGEAYVSEIQRMIQGNDLNTLGPLDLAR